MSDRTKERNRRNADQQAPTPPSSAQRTEDDADGKVEDDADEEGEDDADEGAENDAEAMLLHAEEEPATEAIIAEDSPKE